MLTEEEKIAEGDKMRKLFAEAKAAREKMTPQELEAMMNGPVGAGPLDEKM